MLGKPPSITYQAIEYHATPSPKNHVPEKRASSPRSTLDIQPESKPRPSIGSVFSEYDDLRDFDGRFESRSTLGAARSRPSLPDGKALRNSRKPSKGFLTRWKSSSQSIHSLPDERSLPGGRRLKALRSMGSLKGSSSRKPLPFTGPRLPPSYQIEVSFGLNGSDWTGSNSKATVGEADPVASRLSTTSHDPYRRPSGRRSISLSSPKPVFSPPASPSFTTSNSSFTASVAGGNESQAALGNALIAASHAESANGTHNDLLQILNHENHSWGFSYSSYPHTVKVWYGDKDEKIADNAVRWMVRTMGEDRCSLKMIKGADHGLLYRTSVVVEVFEHLGSFGKAGT